MNLPDLVIKSGVESFLETIMRANTQLIKAKEDLYDFDFLAGHQKLKTTTIMKRKISNKNCINNSQEGKMTSFTKNTNIFKEKIKKTLLVSLERK
jgi:hypothetical protein